MILKNILISIFITSSFIAVINKNEALPPPASSMITSERTTPELGITELTLANGMTICLKPSSLQEEELLFHGFSPGGYLLVEPAQRASAKLSAAISWESGLGTLSGDQFAKLLYNHEIELQPLVGPYGHAMEGSVPAENLPQLLEVIHQLFSTPQFSSEALQRVTERTRASLKHRATNPDALIEDAVKSINTTDLTSLSPLSEADLRTVDLNSAKQFYSTHFLNPSTYTFVIVGDFDVDEIKPLIVKHLGSLTAPAAPAQPQPTLALSFPKGVSRRLLKVQGIEESETRMTFCLNVSTTDSDFRFWETASQVIETHLRQAFQNSTHSIDVALEFPLHPKADPIWLTLQFRGPKVHADELIQLAIRELRELQSRGPTPEEVETALKLQECNDEFWEGENSYWLAALSSHYQLQLDLDCLSLKRARLDVAPAQIATFLQKALDLSSYTVVTQQPN